MSQTDHAPAAPLEPEQPHRPPDDNEEVYYEGSPLLRGELLLTVGCTVAGLAFIAIPIAYYLLSKDGVWPAWWLTLALAAIGLIIIVYPLLHVRKTHYRVTNYRIDVERGLIAKRIDTLELWHVDDIDFNQSVTDRILGVGTIEVLSNDKTTPKLSLRSIARPRPLFDLLKKRVIAVKRQRGVVKFDTGGMVDHSHDHSS
jgi:membrane protein YdbS with pleckstrin-like domain